MSSDSSSPPVDIKQWTRIVLILSATLYLLNGGDPTQVLVGLP
jgi:hypothetical protein